MKSLQGTVQLSWYRWEWSVSLGIRIQLFEKGLSWTWTNFQDILLVADPEPLWDWTAELFPDLKLQPDLLGQNCLRIRNGH